MRPVARFDVNMSLVVVRFDVTNSTPRERGKLLAKYGVDGYTEDTVVGRVTLIDPPNGFDLKAFEEESIVVRVEPVTHHH